MDRPGDRADEEGEALTRAAETQGLSPRVKVLDAGVVVELLVDAARHGADGQALTVAR